MGPSMGLQWIRTAEQEKEQLVAKPQVVLVFCPAAPLFG